MEAPFYLLVKQDQDFNLDKYNDFLKNIAIYGCSHVLLYGKDSDYSETEKLMEINYNNKVNTSIIINFNVCFLEEIIENYFGQISYFFIIINSSEDILRYQKFAEHYNRFGIKFILCMFDEKMWVESKQSLINAYELLLLDRAADSVIFFYKDKYVNNSEHYIGFYNVERVGIDWEITKVLLE